MRTPTLLPAIAVFLLLLAGCTAPSGQVTAQTPQGSGGSTAAGIIEIPLSEISTQAKWYEYDAGGTTVRFFAVKASDGSVKTAFDACDVCYNSKKGYRQSGTDMVCNNCGNKYPIDGLGVANKTPGGCWPSFLPSEISGNSLTIRKTDIEKGKGMFA
ncbi:DUF2318 domain-containing protein [Candidatus Micrarchaeota archaeon]|nr:DUF2318 domain-containing protein [Candidatus Micrarchaeota archaeon]MBU1939487.1 DUF2318 domain-containing protein [Candidatus Micrarchaeota archaeon]